MRRALILIIATAFLAAGCGEERPSGDGPGRTEEGFDAPIPADAEAYPIMVSSEIVVGENRLLMGVLNGEDAPIGSRALAVAADFFFLERSSTEPVTSAEFSFIETIPGERGLYVTEVELPDAGKWGAEVAIRGDGIEETVKTSFDVLEEPATPPIGSRAPASDTPTLSETKDLSSITTDAHPDRDFYRTSIREALRAREPFVVVFATPKFCTSAVCGPTLGIVKDVAKDVRGVSFIHVEVYTNLDDPANLEVVPSVKQWHLPTEPWVFVVDERGRVAAKYEGTVARSELRAALQML